MDVFEQEALNRRMLYNIFPDFRRRILDTVIAENACVPMNIDKIYLQGHPSIAEYLKLRSLKPTTDKAARFVYMTEQISSTKMYLECLLLSDGVTKDDIIKYTGITSELYDFFTYLIFDESVFTCDLDKFSYVENIADPKEKALKTIAYKYGVDIINFIFGKRELALNSFNIAETLYYDAAIKALHASFYTFDSDEAMKASTWGSKAISYISAIKMAFKEEKTGDVLKDIIDKLEINVTRNNPLEEASKLNPEFKIE